MASYDSLWRIDAVDHDYSYKVDARGESICDSGIDSGNSYGWNFSLQLNKSFYRCSLDSSGNGDVVEDGVYRFNVINSSIFIKLTIEWKI